MSASAPISTVQPSKSDWARKANKRHQNCVCIHYFILLGKAASEGHGARRPCMDDIELIFRQ